MCNLKLLRLFTIYLAILSLPLSHIHTIWFNNKHDKNTYLFWTLFCVSKSVLNLLTNFSRWTEQDDKSWTKQLRDQTTFCGLFTIIIILSIQIFNSFCTSSIFSSFLYPKKVFLRGIRMWFSWFGSPAFLGRSPHGTL